MNFGDCLTSFSTTHRLKSPHVTLHDLIPLEVLNEFLSASIVFLVECC